VKRLLLILPLLAGCAGAEHDGVLSGSPSFRAKTVALASTRGARGKGVELSRELTRRLEAMGLAVAALEESDSVLAGSAVGLEAAANPRLLDEIRRATGADAIIFLSLDPNWASLDVSALDARTGEAVLRSAIHPSGESFHSASEAAAAAAKALSPLAADRPRPKASRPDDPPIDEIPLP
jgi:hypothetical protein